MSPKTDMASYPQTMFALKCSVGKMLVETRLEKCEPGELWNVNRDILPLSGRVALWTFTTPKPVELKQLARMWREASNQMVRVFRRRGMAFRLARVFEPSPTMRWHVHAVAAEFLPVGMIRTLVKKYGFGRIDVQSIPASEATYVAKYLGKYLRRSRPEEEAGVRMWSCVGFRGFSASDVTVRDSWVQEVLDRSGPQVFTDKLAWQDGCRVALDWRLAQSRVGETQPKVMAMTKKQEEFFLTLANKGLRLQVVEYRSTVIVENAKWIAGVPSATEKQYTAEHMLEPVGGPGRVVVSEALPGSYVKGTAINLAPKGTVFVYEQTGFFTTKMKKTVESGILHPFPA